MIHQRSQTDFAFNSKASHPLPTYWNKIFPYCTPTQFTASDLSMPLNEIFAHKYISFKSRALVLMYTCLIQTTTWPKWWRSNSSSSKLLSKPLADFRGSKEKPEQGPHPVGRVAYSSCPIYSFTLISKQPTLFCSSRVNLISILVLIMVYSFFKNTQKSSASKKIKTFDYLVVLQNLLPRTLNPVCVLNIVSGCSMKPAKNFMFKK